MQNKTNKLQMRIIESQFEASKIKLYRYIYIFILIYIYYRYIIQKRNCNNLYLCVGFHVLSKQNNTRKLLFIIIIAKVCAFFIFLFNLNLFKVNSLICVLFSETPTRCASCSRTIYL